MIQSEAERDERRDPLVVRLAELCGLIGVIGLRGFKRREMVRFEGLDRRFRIAEQLLRRA